MEAPLLICVRVLDMEVEPAEGSAAMNCSVCGAAIWVARSSQGMLAGSGTCRLVCMQCATELTKSGAAEVEPEESVPARIARLHGQAEAAYDAMYELHDERQIQWQFELATDLLISAGTMAREAGMSREADEMERRREHIRRMYYQQFVQPPHLLM